ncbi:hypothetical protein SASPL_133160 [Salvia splendens]|uniref:Disease resistance protein RPM1 n=1 Tax=Salvia splendens TaxID=180675 RepID=A0A8X8ZIV1_SALSN|nr:hypothetical protein SASPL_133160 [Salvia splendens]
MADAVISVVVERVAAIIEDNIRYEVTLVRGVEKELLHLSDKLRTIRNVLDDAEKRTKDQSVKSWLKKIENTAYEMDDILDEWDYYLFKHKMKASVEQKYMFGENPRQIELFIEYTPVTTALQFEPPITHHDVGTSRNVGTSTRDGYPSFDVGTSRRDDEYHSFEFNTSGREVDEPLDVPNLTCDGYDGSDNGDGADGSDNCDGADNVGGADDSDCDGSDGSQPSDFDYSAESCEDSTDDEALDMMVEKYDVQPSVRGEQSVPNYVPEGLPFFRSLPCEGSRGKKFLLVLDDVWTEKYDEWEPLKINLRKGAVLSDEECWSLLRRISLSGRDGEELEEFESVGKKIATKCSGLPLAANVLGRLLQFKYNLQEWEDVEKSEIWQLENADVDLFPHLVLSYNDLSPPLKRCFSYCAIYPKDHKIQADRLIEEWMALGYLGSVSGNGEVEHKGRWYLSNLAMRSLFQDIEKSESGEQIEWCKMHDFDAFLRKNDNKDDAAKMRKESCQVCDPLLVSQAKEYRSLFLDNRRHVGLCDCISSVRVFRLETRQGMEKLIHVRRLELSGNKLKDEDLKIICRLYFLQTLLLSRCSLRNIPGDLVRLRNLDLSSNGFIDLSESICRLVELQTLYIISCDKLYKLPEGIHMLENLQHIFIDRDRDRASQGRLVQGVAQLSGLRTFGYLSSFGIENLFRLARDANKFELLKNLNLLTATLGLEIFCDTIPDVEELARTAGEAELRKKIHVHSLRIIFLSERQWGYHSGQEENSRLSLELIEALQPHQM